MVVAILRFQACRLLHLVGKSSIGVLLGFLLWLGLMELVALGFGLLRTL